MSRHRPKLCVMKLTPVGEGRVAETRFGPWLVSIDAAVNLAAKVGGIIYERLPGTTGLKLRADLLNGVPDAKN
jgi:hypothetical protein